jgi:thiol:disulfide interchange protein DsbD
VLGASKARSKLQALALTSAYILGMGLVFSLAGLSAALSGQAFGALLSSRWVLLGLFFFMALLAASMLGAFELRLPFSWTQRLGRLGSGGGLGAALLMGGAAGLLAAPCTGPILSGLLAYIAQRQAVWLGGVGLFLYAMGIGVPFFLVGVFAVRLPKGGRWMVAVKTFLGVVLAVFALGYLKDAWPAFEGVLAWLAHSLGGRATGLAVTGGVLFVAILWGGLRRNADRAFLLGVVLLAILLRFELPPSAELRGAPFVWEYRFSAREVSALSFDEVLQEARERGQPVLVDFFAQWCAACKELDKISFADARVQKEAERFVRVKVDGTLEGPQIEALYTRFSVRGLPTVAFVDSQGELLSKPRVEGFLGPRELLRRMQQVR